MNPDDLIDLADFLDRLAEETGRADVRERAEGLRRMIDAENDFAAGDDL